MGRATPAARATIEWAPSAPTTTRQRSVPGPSADRVARTGRPPSRSTRLDRDAAPDDRAGLGGQRLERRIERRPVEADRGRPAGLRSVGQPDDGAARCLEPHRRDRAGDASSAGSVMPTRRRASTVTGELNTPPARQRQAGCRSRTTTSTPVRARAAPARNPPGRLRRSRRRPPPGADPHAALTRVRAGASARPACGTPWPRARPDAGTARRTPTPRRAGPRQRSAT